jgi:cob(I)alamin adenosyltransferase
MTQFTFLGMSIATKTGDLGTTSLMFNRRVSKCHPRVEVCGSADELNSTLGFARAMVGDNVFKAQLERIQTDLIGLMGELATLPEDWAQYQKAGYAYISQVHVNKLDLWITEMESQGNKFCGWATPGANQASGALDMARSICRRVERQICALFESGQMPNSTVMVYLNRLSDVLWLMARRAEKEASH